MKKTILSLCLVLLTLSALADTALTGEGSRGITIQPAGVNAVEEGVSPTTGLPLGGMAVPEGFVGLAVTGRYMPMLVQIDNAQGGVGETAPWGAAWADIIYETPLTSPGGTRMSFLFSDLIPNAVGPVRSARVGHVWLRQEWDCGFMFFGGQTLEGSNINLEFSTYGAKRGEVVFNGTDGLSKAWVKLFSTRKGCLAPHNRSGDAAAISSLIPENHTAREHAFLFSDDPPEGGDTAGEIDIDRRGYVPYCSTLRYEPDSGQYSRFMHREDGGMALYEDRDTRTALTFSNVIVQFVEQGWNGSGEAPVTELVGEGKCELFRDGRHYAGVWQRTGMNQRTVFYGEDGSELPLQRGKTLIVILPRDYAITYR